MESNIKKYMKQLKQESYTSTEKQNEHFFEEEVYVEQVLETIDNEKLQDFLVSQLRPAGFDEQKLRESFLYTDLVTKKNTETGALAWADGRKINFEPEVFLRSTEVWVSYLERMSPLEDPSKKDHRFFDVAKLVALSSFIHEQLHHITFSDTEYDRTSFTEKQGEIIKEEFFYRYTGIEEQVEVDRIVEKKDINGTVENVETDYQLLYRGLNEGLTEIMAQQLTQEFIRQHPMVEDTKIVSRLTRAWVEYGAYKEERMRVEQLAAVLSEVTEVPSDILLKSFFHEYVTNGQILPKEFEKVIKEYMPDISPSDLESFIASIRQALIDESFNKDSEINDTIRKLIEILPKDKADRCKDKLASIYKKYNPSQLPN